MPRSRSYHEKLIRNYTNYIKTFDNFFSKLVQKCMCCSKFEECKGKYVIFFHFLIFRALTEFLTILGVDKKIADEDACEMEHILHPNTIDIVTKFVEIVNQCGVTPFWLGRLKKYVKTGKLQDCPSELSEICRKYDKN